jgi:translation initiation factor 2 subunit 3
VWTKAKDLRVSDYVAFLAQVPLEEGVQFPDPFGRLRERYDIVNWQDCQRLEEVTDGFSIFSGIEPRGFEQLRILSRLPNTEFCRRAGIDPKTWRGILAGTKRFRYPVRARLAACFAHLRPKGLKPGEFMIVQRSGSPRHIRKLREFNLDSDLAKWFAFVWSEGSSGKGFVDVTQTVEKEMLREYLRISREKLGLMVRRYKGGIYKTYDTPFVDYLRFKFGFAPGNKYESPISSWVCRLPRDEKATFLRWFLTLDGEFNTKAGQISVTQANDRNIVVISYLLASFGIIPRFGKLSRQVKAGRRTYSRLSISGRRNLRLFAENIRFESSRKQQALLEYLRRIKEASKESDLSIPLDAASLRHLMRRIGLTRERFKPRACLSSMKGSSWYKAYEGLARTGRISRPKLLQMAQSLQDHFDLVENSMNELHKNPGALRRHFAIIGMSLEQVSEEMGIGRRRLMRMLERGSRTERAAITDFAIHRTAELLKEAGPGIDQLRTLSSTPLEFDRIKFIERENYEGKVFDLTVPEYANFIAGKGAIVCHNTTLTQAITGIWASAHSEELKRGITIKVGYADAAFYKCSEDHGVGVYSTSSKCPICGRKTTFLRAVSFVDCPGHESLMTNMLAGAFLMDGALLVIASNEPVPKPQTREHLQALQMLGMKKIVIAQNKVDLVTDAEAKKNFEQIKKFVQGTVAEDAPVIPISAQQRLNIDALIEALEDVIPTPVRDVKASPLMYVVRSFDVNRPGAEISGLSGGVLGGSLTRGELKVGDEIELKPGMIEERSGKFAPVITRISSLQTGAGSTEKVGPGGLVAVGTHLDPTYTKGDQMVGSVIGRPGTLPETLEHVKLDVTLLETAVGATELVKVDKVKLGENVRLNLGTASTQAVVTSVRGDVVEMDLKKPVAIELGMRAAISRRIAERWRLIGSGILK